MPGHQIFIGVAFALLCLLGLWREKWLLTNSGHGQRLTRWFGEARARWVLRALLIAGAVFGALLAANVIRPVQW